MIKVIDRCIFIFFILLLLPLQIFFKFTKIDRNNKRILLCKFLGGGSLYAMGDFILTLKRDGYRVDILASESTKLFAKEMGIFDNIYLYKKFNYINNLKIYIRLLKAHYEWYINIEFHSLVIALLGVIVFIPKRVGLYNNYNKIYKLVYSHSFYRNQTQNIYNIYRVLFSPLVNDNIASFNSFYLNHGIGVDYSNIKLDINQKDYIVLVPFSSSLHKERMPQLKDWSSILKLNLLELDSQIFIIGSKSETSGGEHLKEVLIKSGFKYIKNICGEYSFGEFIHIIRHSALVISVDSGFLHIARALSKKVISIWGPSSPYLVLSNISPLDTVVYKNLYCSPCARLSHPPCLGDNVCLNFNNDQSNVNAYWRR